MQGQQTLFPKSAMVDLNSFTFTRESDIAEVFDDAIFNDTLVKTFKGDDLIKNSAQSGANLDFGIFNDSSGTIDMAQGNDSLSGSGNKGIVNEGIIRTGTGDDYLSGSGNKGIVNKGIIRTGSGNDFVKGYGFDGIVNEGTILSGSGDDSLIGAGYYGMTNNGKIRTGDGNDVIGGGADPSLAITNNDLIDMGQGDDFLDARGYYSGIINYGTINMGKGNDALTGVGKSNGVVNYGTIDMGEGNDSLYGNSGGFGIGNKGTIDMGAGNDVIEGYSIDGVGVIDLGIDNDLIKGSWRGNDRVVIDGGAGLDKAQFNLDLNKVDVAIISDNSLALTSSDGEMTLTDIELFELNDFSFSFDELSTFSTLDFDEGNLAAGTIVTDQFEGISISTSSEFGVMIFDTGNPTGGDVDLSTRDLGNVLIISEDGDSNDPDDNAAGGTITIDFDNLATVTSLELLDIDRSGGSIDFFDDDSNLIEALEIEALGDGSRQEITPNVRGVAQMEINLAGSGALTQLNFFDSIDNSEVLSTNSEWT